MSNTTDDLHAEERQERAERARLHMLSGESRCPDFDKEKARMMAEEIVKLDSERFRFLVDAAVPPWTLRPQSRMVNGRHIDMNAGHFLGLLAELHDARASVAYLQRVLIEEREARRSGFSWEYQAARAGWTPPKE